jgi:tape measure domain-containing protein
MDVARLSVEVAADPATRELAQLRTSLRQTGTEAKRFELGLKNLNIVTKTYRDSAGNIIKTFDQVDRKFAAATQRVSGLSVIMRGFTRVLVGLFAVDTLLRGVSAFASMTDEAQRLESRLRLVTTSSGQLERSWDALLDISQRTRTDLSANVLLFQRLKFAQDSLGATDRELLGFTETLTRAIASAGLTTAEASSAVIQITQALNAGRFQGDEFRSVMENMPTVMQAVADRLGVTKGELKGLASQGKITASVFFDAVMDMRESGKGLGEVPKTIENAFTRLNNKLKDYTASNRTLIGLHSAVVSGLDFIADHLNDIADALARVIENTPGFRELLLLIKSFQQPEPQAAARSQLEATTSRIEFLKKEIAGINEGLKAGVIPENIIEHSRQLLIDDEAELNRLLREQVLLRAALSGGHGPSSRPRLSLGPPKPETPPPETDRAAERIRDTIESLEFERQQLTRTSAEQAVYNALKQAGTTINTVAGQTIRNLVLDIRAVTEAQQAEADEIARVGELMDEGRSITERFLSPLEEYQRSLERLNELLAEGAISQTTFARATEAAREALDRQGTDFATGARNAFGDYAAHALNAAENVENVLTNAFFAAEDALTEFVVTGKANFADLADSIITDIARIAIRMTILGPLANLLGGLFDVGPPADLLGLIQPRAAGGPVTRGRVYEINETGASEYFIPNASGRVVPAANAWRGGASVVNFNDTINVSVPASMAGDPAAAEKIGGAVRRAVRAEVLDVMRGLVRPGGGLNQGPSSPFAWQRR